MYMHTHWVANIECVCVRVVITINSSTSSTWPGCAGAGNAVEAKLMRDGPQAIPGGNKAGTCERLIGYTHTQNGDIDLQTI